MKLRSALTTTLLIALAPGCDKSSSQPTNPPPPSDSGAVAADDGAADGGAAADDAGGGDDGAEEVDLEAMKFDDMNWDQRKEYMGIFVFPAMKKAFKAHDEALYKKFTCDTCHGDDAKEVKYAMPTDSIYPLPKDDPLTAAKDYDEEVTKFMEEVVVPEMATLLKEEPGPNGFWCMECHPAE